MWQIGLTLQYGVLDKIDSIAYVFLQCYGLYELYQTIKLFVVGCDLLCLLATAWVSSVTFTGVLLVLVPKCQNCHG